jgi:stage II sporulation protein R
VKYIGICIGLIICLGCVLFSIGSGEEENTQIFRLHIRANSNLEIDQSVKMEIKEEFVKYLTPYVADCESKQEVIEMTNSVLNPLKAIADRVLERNGFDYVSNVKICNEYFPDRYYGDFLVAQGFYDALIVELGEAKGDNWWCVVYPPLCFVDYSNEYCNNVVYKSKIWEIINEYFRKGENE